MNAGSPTGIGGMVRWSDISQLWITFDDSCPVTTDLMSYAVQLHAIGAGDGGSITISTLIGQITAACATSTSISVTWST